MRVLLDTHALIWAMLSPQFLSSPASAEIADERNEILVSAVSAFEIATKVRIGKLTGAEQFELEFTARIKKAGYRLLPVEVECALRAGGLPGPHRDPYDRLLAAQALAEDMPIISRDPKLDSFGVRRIW